VKFDIAGLIRRQRNPRRNRITTRAIQPTDTMAGDLYRAAYQPLIKAWQAATARIAEAYARALPVADSSRIHDAVFDIDSILTTLEDEMQRLVITITPRLREWAMKAEQWHRGQWRRALLTATGIDAQTMLTEGDVADTVDAFVARNVGLVKSVSDEARQRISDIVLRGYQSRIPLRQVAKEMDEAVGLGRARALRTASDQNSKLSARLDDARQEQAGISMFTWHHSYKKHPRTWHQAREGKVYDRSSGDEVDGGSDHIEPGDYPGEPPFCGCRRRATIDLS
jgi:hypothetical protein